MALIDSREQKTCNIIIFNTFLFYSIHARKSLCKLRVEKEPKNRLENDPVKEPRGQQFGIQNRSSYC